MTIDATTVREIAGLAREAERGAANIRWSQMPNGDGWMGVHPETGENRTLPVRRPPYRMRAGSIGGLVAMLKAAPSDATMVKIDGEGEKTLVANALVAVSVDRVEAVLDDHRQRRDRLVLETPPTAMMSYLSGQDGESGPDRCPGGTSTAWLTQQEMIDLLDLATEDGDVTPPTLRASIASIKFAQSTGGEATLATGRHSRSMSAVRELASADGAALPTNVTVCVRVSAEHVALNERGQVVGGYSGNVRCVLQIDPEKLTMRLAPQEEDMANLRRGAVAWVIAEIGNKLAGTGVECSIVDGRLHDGPSAI